MLSTSARRSRTSIAASVPSSLTSASARFAPSSGEAVVIDGDREDALFLPSLTLDLFGIPVPTGASAAAFTVAALVIRHGRFSGRRATAARIRSRLRAKKLD